MNKIHIVFGVTDYESTTVIAVFNDNQMAVKLVNELLQHQKIQPKLPEFYSHNLSQQQEKEYNELYTQWEKNGPNTHCKNYTYDSYFVQSHDVI